MKAYLKIGIYQSVVPCDPNDRGDTTLVFGNTSMRFTFKETSAVERDGIPIMVADHVDIIKL